MPFSPSLHTRAELSDDVVTMCAPSREKDAELTEPRWPFSSTLCQVPPLSLSWLHTRAVSSSDAVTMRAPFVGEKDAELTISLWPISTALCQIPSSPRFHT